MRHVIDILIGSSLDETGKSLKRFLTNNGERNNDSFSHVIYWSKEKAYYVNAISNPDNAFCSDLDEQYRFEESKPLLVENTDVYIKQFFNLEIPKIRSIATQNGNFIDKTISICLFVNLYDSDSTSLASQLISIIRDSEISYDLDIIGLHPDLAFLFDTDVKNIASKNEERIKTANESIKEITKNEKAYRHFIIFQNFNEDGISLNLDKNTFIKIIGEYTMICVENYDKIYNDLAIDKKFTGFGLSMMFLDEHYFSNFLLQSTFIYILEKEKIKEKVNIDEAVKFAQGKLKESIHVLSDFYDLKKNDLYYLDDSETIFKFKVDIPQVCEALEEKIKNLKTNLQSIISDTTKTLQFKRAVLAQMLGEDDNSLVNCTFYTNLLTIDDCVNESLNVYVEANNESVRSHIDENGKIIIDTQGVLPANDENGHVDLKLDLIRTTHEHIINTITSIRNIDKEISELERNLNIDKKSNYILTENGIVIQGGSNVQYKLQHDVAPDVFNSYYEPTNIEGAKDIVDLRPNFTSIKDQGPAGTCTIFAITSIYEYILKKTEAKEYDLSEHFVYYNINSTNKKEEGTSFVDVIKSITDDGICEEETCKYVSDKIDKKPSQKAYEEAKLHKIQTVKGVKILHDDIISALNEGYPIAISLKIFNSFMDCPGGSVMLPSPDEMNADSHTSHAMVICGYSIKDKMYFVRNSWGESWGDKGYCYIPFDYIEDEHLDQSACIITSINNDIETRGIVGPEKVSFNNIDKHLLYSIQRINRKEQEAKKDKLINEYSNLHGYYLKIRSKLQVDERKEISQHKMAFLNDEIKKAQEDIDQFKNETRPKEEKEFGKKKDKCILIQLGIIIILLASWFLGFKFIDNWTSKGISWICVILFIVLVLILIVYYICMLKEEKANEKKHNEEETALNLAKKQKEEELSSTELKMHLAGRLIDEFSTIQCDFMNTYKFLTSYIDNLSTWYDEEKQKINMMVPVAINDSFIPLLSNDALRNYFDQKKDNIVEGIYLCQLFNKYDVENSSIEKFKLEMKKTILDKLSSLLKDFTVYRYMTGEMPYTYPYLNSKNVGLEKISLLDDRNKVFINPHTKPSKYYQYLFIYTDSKESNLWNSEVGKHFCFPPVALNTTSYDKFIVLRIEYFSESDVVPLV
jgi:C1A family cysteine protease